MRSPNPRAGRGRGLGAPEPQKGGTEAPGELKRLARSAAPDADSAHRTPRPHPAGAVGDPGHRPRRPLASSSLLVPVSTGGSLSHRVYIPRGPHSSSSIPPGPPHPSPSCRIRSRLQSGFPSEHKGREAWKHKAGAAHPAPVSPVRPCTPVPAGSACCSRHRVGPGSGGSACARGPSCLAGGAKPHCGSRAPSR